MRKEKAMQHVLMILTGVMLIVSVGGCGSYADEIREMYDKKLKVEEIDDGVYMIAASMDSFAADRVGVPVMKESVLKKAREHCAQENKVIKVVNLGGSQSGASTGPALGVPIGGLMPIFGGGSSANTLFDLVFQCRERTTPAETPSPTPDAP